MCSPASTPAGCTKPKAYLRHPPGSSPTTLPAGGPQKSQTGADAGTYFVDPYKPDMGRKRTQRYDRGGTHMATTIKKKN